MLTENKNQVVPFIPGMGEVSVKPIVKSYDDEVDRVVVETKNGEQFIFDLSTPGNWNESGLTRMRGMGLVRHFMVTTNCTKLSFVRRKLEKLTITDYYKAL